MLTWHFDYRGEWEAPSAIVDPDGSGCYWWTIGVCDDGTFDIHESSPELLEKKRISTFPNLTQAKDYCNGRETYFLELAKIGKSVTQSFHEKGA